MRPPLGPFGLDIPPAPNPFDAKLLLPLLFALPRLPCNTVVLTVQSLCRNPLRLIIRILRQRALTTSALPQKITQTLVTEIKIRY